ncbi:MAG: hypothetical protein ACM3S0_12595 [Acidobacteriota bacterium]
MPIETLVFPFWRIALTAGIAFAASLILLLWRYKEFSTREVVIISTLVGVSVLLWRMAGNVAQLNDDPIPLLSPNDVLCPVVTYVLLGSYGAFRDSRIVRWGQVRALLTLVSFAVNVVTI